MQRPSRDGTILVSLRHAFADFLTVPALIVAAFIALAAATTTLDAWEPGFVDGVRDGLSEVLFPRPQSTSSLLAVVAGGLITIASITFSLLLLALQQAASTMTHEVLDQFLRRGVNQVFFGFFVGLSLFSLIVLATVNEDFNPVLGATTALVLAGVSFLFLVTLIYTTVQQMRPGVIVDAIYSLTRAAHERHAELVAATRRAPRDSEEPSVTVPADARGFLTHVDLARLARAGADNGVEIDLVVPLGGYRAEGEPVAHVRGAGAELPDALDTAVRDALRFEPVRDLHADPAHGIAQLTSIAWTTISSSKQNPAPGLLVNFAVRDLVARFAGAAETEHPQSRVVYPDTVFRSLLSAVESLAVVASESLQDQNFAETVRTLTLAVERATPSRRPAVEESVVRVLAALGELVLTSDLDDALRDLERGLREGGSHEVAERVEQAHAQLAESVGRLASRATRATDG